MVTGIIALLAGLLLPALGRAKAMGKQSVCLNNLRGVGLAAFNYADDYRYYPPAWQASEVRWMDSVKPYLSKQSGVYRCPADPLQQAVTWDPEIVLSYGINCFNFHGDPASCFWYGVRADAVIRPSGTILFADCTPGKYYCGGGGTFSEPVVDVNYRHAGVTFCAAFGDGHVEGRRATIRRDWDVASP